MGEFNRETIKIAIEAEFKEKGIAGLQDNLNKLQLLGAKTAESYTKIATRQKIAFEKLKANTKANTLLGNRFSNTMVRLAESLRRLTMPMLGVMFFGMMLKQTFLGLLQPAADAFGIFDMFGAMLLVTFIPIMESLAGPLYTIMGWFMDLPEPVQKVIGAFVLLIGSLGVILAVVGMLGLGLNGIIDSMVKLGAITLDKATGQITAVEGGMASLKASVLGFTWGALAVLGWAILAIGAFYLMKDSLDKFYASSKLAAEKSEQLDTIIQDLGKTILNDFLSIFDDINLKIENWGETQVYVGAVIHNTIIGLIAIFQIFYALLRAIFNIVQFLGSVGMFDFSGAKQQLKDIKDTWEDFKSGAQANMNASISPSEAVNEYRKQKEADVQTLVDGLLKKQKEQQSVDFINSLRSPSLMSSATNNNSNVNLTQYNTINTGANASDVTSSLSEIGNNIIMKYSATGGNATMGK